MDKTTSGKVTDEYVKFVVEFDVPDACALSLLEVKAETKKDKILSRVLSLVQASSWSTEVGIKPFNADKTIKSFQPIRVFYYGGIALWYQHLFKNEF